MSLRRTVLKGRTALITGSTSGIGLGIARVLASQGANIMLNGFGERKAIESVQSQLQKEFGVKVGYDGADLKDPEQTAAMVRNTLKALGSCDILVNNAGIQHVAPIDSFPSAKWEDILRINLSAVFYSTREALPAMRKQKWGRIINISSVHGLVASTNKSAYVAAKHGVMGLVKTTALETAGSGITCNAINPGWVLTPLVQAQIDARAKEKKLTNEQATADLLGEKQPSKIFTTVDQIGETTAFLCSDAATNITGIAIPMDGGWTSQ